MIFIKRGPEALGGGGGIHPLILIVSLTKLTPQNVKYTTKHKHLNRKNKYTCDKDTITQPKPLWNYTHFRHHTNDQLDFF